VIRARTPEESPTERMAEVALAGLAANAVTSVEFLKPRFGDLDLAASLEALTTTVERINAGDLREAESLLTAQALSLNTIYTELARRAMLNMGQYLDATERYMRLALKAQGQCRATLETLANMKNPPTVITRQANIAHGPQQVNNGVPLARAGNLESAPNELMETPSARLDTGTSGATSQRHTALATLATIDRPANT
jgi:thioredoxin-like negative regulator of GroEL